MKSKLTKGALSRSPEPTNDVESLLLLATGQQDTLYVIEHLESPDGERLVAERPAGVKITEAHRLTFPGALLAPIDRDPPDSGSRLCWRQTIRRYTSRADSGWVEWGALAEGQRRPLPLTLRRSSGQPPSQRSVLTYSVLYWG